MIVDNETNETYTDIADYISRKIPTMPTYISRYYVQFKFDNHTLSYVPDGLDKNYQRKRKEVRTIEFR